MATFGGTRPIVTMTDKAVVGIEIATGKQLWQIAFPDDWNENIVTPVVAGDMLVTGTRQGTFEELRRYAVADGQAWAHPVLVTGGVIIRSGDSVAVWTVEPA